MRLSCYPSGVKTGRIAYLLFCTLFGGGGYSSKYSIHFNKSSKTH